MLRLLPAGSSMIATEVASPFFAPIKLAAVVAFIAAMPWVLWQVWAFVAPGLYKSEKRLVAPLMTSSTLLFYGGGAFAYYLVLPTVLDRKSVVVGKSVLVRVGLGGSLIIKKKKK